MKEFFSFKRNRGFTMLEMIIAVFILVVGIIGSYSAFSRIIVATSIISSKLTAAYLGQEGIEIIRNIRDTSWLENPEIGWNNNLSILFDCFYGPGCEADYTTGTDEETTSLRSYTESPLYIDNNGFYSYSTSDSPTRFKRKIKVSRPTGNDVLRVSVQVFWEDRGKPYDFLVEEDLYNWY